MCFVRGINVDGNILRIWRKKISPNRNADQRENEEEEKTERNYLYFSVQVQFQKRLLFMLFFSCRLLSTK